MVNRAEIAGVCGIYVGFGREISNAYGIMVAKFLRHTFCDILLYI